MKKTYSLLIIFLLAVMAFSFSGCADAKTELAFINSTDSSAAINDIAWADDNGTDVTWEKERGYANDGTQTESKEVSIYSGNVDCALIDDDENEIDVESVRIEGTSENNLSFAEGGSYTYTLIVTGE